MGLDPREDILVSGGRFEALRPRAPRVENIPPGFFAPNTPRSGVVIAKPLNDDVPQRFEMADEKALSQWDEDFINYEPTASEIR